MKNTESKSYFKKNTKRTILIVLSIILIGICMLAITNGFYKEKIESKINKNINNYEFDENSKLSGISIQFKDVKCNGLFLYECNLEDFTLYFNSSLGKMPLLESNKTTLKPKSITNIFAFYIDAENVVLGNKLEKNIFIYEEEPYKSIGENLKGYFFPLSLKIDVDIKKRSKNKADGYFKIEVENKTAKADFKSEIFIDNREYNEVIPVTPPEGYDGDTKAEIVSNNVPFFAKLDNINYYIEDRDFKGFIYEIYKLNAYNLKREQSAIIPEYNMFYLGVDKDYILEKEEFEPAFLKMINSYISSIPEEEKSYKKILFSLEKILKGDIKSVEIKAKNIGNTTIEKTGLLFMIDEFNTTRKYLDESFDIKIKENK